MKRRLQFFAAVTVAAIYGIRRFTWAEIWFSVKSIWRAMFFKAKPAPWIQFSRRMRRCESCSLFYRKLGTCGSPFLAKEFRHLGCWCHCDSKARIQESTCWLDDNCPESTDDGWKEV